MKLWTILAMASAAVAFTATAQAQCPGGHHALKTAANAAATGRIATNGSAANKLASNAVSVAPPGAGTTSHTLAVKPPTGVRLAR